MMVNAGECIDPTFFYLRLFNVKVNFIRHVLYPSFVFVWHLWFFSSAQPRIVMVCFHVSVLVIFSRHLQEAKQKPLLCNHWHTNHYDLHVKNLLMNHWKLVFHPVDNYAFCHNNTEDFICINSKLAFWQASIIACQICLLSAPPPHWSLHTVSWFKTER